MSRPIARLLATYGLQGCYMPDSHYGTVECSTRRELVAFIRDALAFYDLPKSAIRQVCIKRLWSFIKAHGSSTVHFCIADGEHNMVEFHGLTESEYAEHNAEE